MSNLTTEQAELLNTNFPAEMEKEAAAQAALISDLYSTGFSKLAAEHADEADKEEKEEEGEHEKKAFTAEMEKEASDRGAFIARGFIDGLIKEGSERHGDELHYFYPALEEKLASMKDDLINKAKKHNPFSAVAIAAKGAKVGKTQAERIKELAAAKVTAHKRQLAGAAAGAGALGAVGGYMAGKKRKED